MYKRRRKDNLYKFYQNNFDSDKPAEDYTADFGAYDFINDDIQKKIGFTCQNKKSNFQESYESLKSDFSHLLNESDDLNNEYICRDFVRNICRRGRKCKYSHPASIKRLQLQKENANTIGQLEINFCHDFQNHGCNRPQCRFIHCNRPEQEFYFATGILLSGVYNNNNNTQVPYCKDYLNNACTRIKCKFLHLSKEEIEQQNKSKDNVGKTMEYSNYTYQSPLDQNVIQPGISNNATFYSNYQDHFSSKQQIGVLPSQTISLGNNLPLTNTQFTVSLPLGSVSYSTSHQQLIAQPSLTNVQYIQDPILSSVAHEVGSINSDVLNHLPASNQHTMVNQIQPQQVLYSSIIHNPGASLPQHHPIQSQFTLISSDNQNHSQLLSAPLVGGGGSSNTTAHIINPAVAVAHPNPNPNQQYTLNKPPVGMSILSVATPCSLLSAPCTTAEMMHTIQQQQIRNGSFDQNDQNCIVQKGLQINTNIDLSSNDTSQINSTLTPIYIQHNLPSSVPVTQYRVTALETTTTPGLVIHNAIDHNNLQLLKTTTANKTCDQLLNFSNVHSEHQTNKNSKFIISNSSPDEGEIDQIIKENENLKRKLIDLQKQTSDLQTANELLLNQNARLRNLKTWCFSSGNNISLDSKASVSHESDDRTHISHNSIFNNIHHNSSNPINNQSLMPKKNEVAPNSISEMATITLTVPISISHSNSNSDHSVIESNTMTSNTNDLLLSSNKLKVSSAEINYLLSSNHEESTQKSMSSTTTLCSDYISPTLVNSALRSIQKTVMPTLHALVASSNIIKTDDKKRSEDDNNVIKCNKFSNSSIPIRSSSCPVACTYKSLSDQVIKCEESSSLSKVCFKLSNSNQTPQLCFQ